MNKFKTSALFDIAYRTFGDPLSPAIVLLHGNSCNSGIFAPQFTALFEEYYLIAPDFIGHGGSGRSEDAAHYSMQGLAKSIVELIHSLNIDQLIVYGVSLGGHVAMEMLPLLPYKIKGIMISGSPPLKHPLNTAEGFTDSPVMAKAFQENINIADIQAWADACIHENEGAKSVLMASIAETEPTFRTKFGDSVAAGEGISNQFEIIHQTDLPIALLQGEYEWLVNNDYIAQSKPKDLFNHKVHIISDAAHFPSLENPEEFNEKLREFVKYSLQ